MPQKSKRETLFKVLKPKRGREYWQLATVVGGIIGIIALVGMAQIIVCKRKDPAADILECVRRPVTFQLRKGHSHGTRPRRP